MTNYLKMTKQELKINTVMDRLVKKEILLKEARIMINKSSRQTIRIKEKYLKEWSKWLIHKLRWRPSNNKVDESKYTEAIQIITDKYYDFWPTLSSEMLAKHHNYFIPVSTLRLQMIKAWIWKNKTVKTPGKQFTARPRKDTYWEMIQYDGSYHLWFEWRNGTAYQCLLVAIDDATWKVTAQFAQNEGIIETFTFWKEYIETNGKPHSIYLDKFATYKVNYPNATDDKQLPTQFWRACNKLNINLIFANTPQAKGRVERMNKTLQDRLVKALRLENISDIDSANNFLKKVFLPEFNKKFMVEPKSNSDLHISLKNDEVLRLDQIFATYKKRKIANDFTIKFNNQFYQLYRQKDWEYMIKPWYTVDVEIHLNWDIKISRFWKYIIHTISFDRPERKHKLLTAPIYDSHLKLFQKKEISQKSDISTLTNKVTF